MRGLILVLILTLTPGATATHTPHKPPTVGVYFAGPHPKGLRWLAYCSPEHIMLTIHAPQDFTAAQVDRVISKALRACDK